MNKLFKILLFLFLVSCHSTSQNEKTGVIGKNAGVATAHPIASEVGLKILKEGGNAFDAAIAVHFTLSVVYPRAGNIGGGGFAVYRLQDGTTGSLDFREMAPGRAQTDMYLDEGGNPVASLSRNGILASGVPGSVEGMYM
ncbi:MAG: gamma-glutamyltransferase, partial [Bacteroidota bacterium]|nr:gamma-glutamyltransferase [Bacteroidota bacterium]